ncbi:MAG: hypothetical protein WBA13_01175 [Microcoleaceae cyanobacterium]
MSWVTDIILIFSIAEMIDEEDEELDIEIPVPLININSWLHQNGKRTLDNLSEHISGKGMQACVYGGAFNFLDIDGFKETVKAQNWKARENVQLLIQEEQDERFSLYTLDN